MTIVNRVIVYFAIAQYNSTLVNIIITEHNQTQKGNTQTKLINAVNTVSSAPQRSTAYLEIKSSKKKAEYCCTTGGDACSDDVVESN